MLASRLLDLLFIARFFYFTSCIMDQTTLEHLFFKRFLLVGYFSFQIFLDQQTGNGAA